MVVGARTSSSGGYRFGYNGMMGDKEWSSQGRLGRWLSTDPITTPWESPYAAFANNPILFNDPSGLTAGDPTTGGKKAENSKWEITLPEIVVTSTRVSKTWSKVNKFFKTVTQDLKKVIVRNSENAAAFVKGADNAILSNMSLDLVGYQYNDAFGIRRLDNSFRFGQKVGNAISMTAGIVTTAAGGLTTFVGGAFGIVTSPTGIGGVAGGTVSLAGVTTTVYGVTVITVTADRIRYMMEDNAGNGNGGGINWKQDKPLPDAEVEKLQQMLKKEGSSVEKLKTGSGSNTGKYDLYYDPKTGDIYIKLKGNKGPGEETGFNRADLK